MCQWCREQAQILEKEKVELQARLDKINKEKADLAQQLEANKVKEEERLAAEEPKPVYVKPGTKNLGPKPMNTEPKTVTPKQSVTRPNLRSGFSSNMDG
jgi:hypothetical protein